MINKIMQLNMLNNQKDKLIFINWIINKINER